MAQSNKPRALRVALAVMMLAGGILGGCEDYRARQDSITMGLGNSVAHNIAVQTIDPWPPNVGDARITVNGERLQGGVDRYKAGKSLPPKGLSTQTINASASTANQGM